MLNEPRPRLRTAAFGVVLACWLVLGGAVAAAAHTQYLGSDPGEGSVLQELPPEVTFEYSDEISPEFVDAALVAPDAQPLEVTAEAQGSAVRIPVAGVADPADGQWQVVVRVVSADGHPVEHSLTFQVAGTADDTASPEPSAPEASAGEPPLEQTPVETPGPTVEPTPQPSPAPSATEADGGSADPLAQAGAGPLGAVLVGLVALAGIAVVVVHLRRRP